MIDPGNSHRVRDALSRCRSLEDVRAGGFLFHGTCEDLEGPLKGGGYDDMFWMAETPAVAQSYIPYAGVEIMISEPLPHERSTRLRPSRYGSQDVMNWAMARAGIDSLDALDPEWDGNRCTSFRILPGWPTYGDLDDHIRDLGYTASRSGAYSVRLCRERGEYEMMPADWSMSGHLVVGLPRDMEIVDPDWSEEALGYATHNRVDDFHRFAAEGVEAIRMSDLLQSKFQGNVGHRSIGVTPAGLQKLDWTLLPARRHDGEDPGIWNGETPDFVAAMKEISPDYRAADDPEDAPEL